MNHKLRLGPALAAAALLLNSCINLPPEVKESVNETRQVVGDLHTAHAQDARAFARMVEKREIEERALRDAVRREAQEQAKAEVEWFKARAMADFDRYAGDLLGIQFQDKVDRDILPKFDSIERKYIEALSDAIAEKGTLSDPATTPKITTAERNLTDLQHQRSSTVISLYLALDAAIIKARFNFETLVTQRYEAELASFLNSLKEDPGAEAALANFQTRTDTKLEQLDKAYFSVDQALSDLSTFLDSEATSRRFIGHVVKGFTEALVDDLKSGQLDGTQLTGSFENKITEFTKNLGQAQTTLQDQAKTAITSAANSVPAPAAPAAPAATASSTQ